MPKTAFDEPHTMLVEMMIRSSPDKMENPIERGERAGQSALVQYGMIPKESNFKEPSIQRRHLEALGFTSIKDDPDFEALFWTTKLPLDWTLEPTDHAMWSHLKDAEGRLRMRIFYKASRYDRRAFVCLNERYSMQRPRPISDDLIDEALSEMNTSFRNSREHVFTVIDSTIDKAVWESRRFADLRAALDAREEVSSAWRAIIERIGSIGEAWLHWWDRDITEVELSTLPHAR